MKADLHYHGAIGFQPYWLKVQGYEGKNLLQLVADSCFSKDLDFCAITSQEKEIPKGSVHDRLDYLSNCASSLPKEYSIDKLGENVIVVEKQGKRVFLINRQTVIVKEGDKRFDHLVVGSNQVPNFMNLEDTLKYGQDEGLIQIAEHPLVEAHFGIGRERLEKHIEDYEAIEGHNSRMIFPSWMPVLGGFPRKANQQAQEIAEKYNKPWVANSDGGKIEDACTSYIEFDTKIATITYGDIIQGLKETIENKQFTNVCNYESFFGWMDFVCKFLWGMKFHRSEV